MVPLPYKGSGLCFSNGLVSDVDNWKSKLYKLK